MPATSDADAARTDQGRGSSAAARAVPHALDMPDPAPAEFSAETMSRQVKVLFIFSRPTNTSASSVHVNLMRHLNRDRVEVHAVFNRLAAGEPYQSAGTSVLEKLSSIPETHLREAEFGPVGGGTPKPQLLAATARAAIPATRDAVQLVSYIRRHGIHVIHSEEGTRDSFYGLVLSRLSGTKCVAHLHVKFAPWMSRPSQFGVRHADAIITVSRWGGEVLRAAGVPGERIFPILNGIDLSGWDPASVSGTGIRQELGIDHDDPLVVIVAQLAYFKRQDVLIEAFRSVADAYPRARLLVVGTETHLNPARGHASYTEYLQQRVRDYGLEGQVIFAGHRRDVKQILAAANIFAMPSIDEPFGLSHVEAMAMARPVVAVDSGGIRELVDHGRTGLLGPVDDARQLAGNIRALIEDPARARSMGESGRRRVHDHLGAQRMADEVEAVYRLLAFGAPH
jgi:glycosyltransferase involved in cell wall biosynthesis